ncbi:MAG: hypothetical protein LBL90_08470, partial [Prevotellaceae bacterium]|nr:hypothetical protein [Prevotellaceae bacterium]
NSAGLVYPNTYGYRYQLKNTCFTPEGRLYIKTISGSPVGLPPATVVVCWEDAVSLSLDRIMGIEAGGVFEPVESSIGDVSRYVEVATAPHIYAGATVFNGREAYLNLSAGDYGITYQGDTDARKVVFKYKITDTNSCLYGNEYTIEIILTSKLIP